MAGRSSVCLGPGTAPSDWAQIMSRNLIQALLHVYTRHNVKHKLEKRSDHISVCMGHRDDGSGLQPTAELFAYDISSNQWHLLGDSEQSESSSDSANPAYHARNAHIFCKVGPALIAHGGWDPFRKTYNDTFVWNP